MLSKSCYNVTKSILLQFENLSIRLLIFINIYSETEANIWNFQEYDECLIKCDIENVSKKMALIQKKLYFMNQVFCMDPNPYVCT